MYGTIVASVIFVSLFHERTYIFYLLIWLGMMAVVSVMRFFLNKSFLKRKNNDDINVWGNRYLYFSALTSSLWGLVWFLVSSDGDVASLAIAGMFTLGITSTPFASYIVYKKAMYFFFIPLVTFATLNYLYVGGLHGNAFALSMIIYSVIILRSSIPVNKYMTESILNKYKLQDEIEERKKIETKLFNLSIVDDLTNLYNRRHFDESLHSILHSAKRIGLPTTLLLLDIDNFKNFNDNYGHVNGDDCLYRVSKAIKSTLKREEDLSFRYGGEEFAVLLPNTRLEDAKKIAQQIRRNVEILKIEHKYSDVEDTKVVTISIGLACVLADKDFADNTLVDMADKALYKAKKGGKNRVVWFE